MRNEWLDIAMRRRRQEQMLRSLGMAALSFFVMVGVGVLAVVGLNHLVIDHAEAIAEFQRQLFLSLGPVR